MEIFLRAVRSSDLPFFFEHQCDVGAAEMVGFTPRTRPAFDEHWFRIMAGPQFVASTVEVDGEVAGYISLFLKEGRTEIAYWFGREYWGRGVGRSAVSAFLKQHRDRPIFGTVAVTNPASVAILRKCGFILLVEEAGPDGLREYVLRLD